MADPYLFRVDFEDRGADYRFTKPVRVRMFGELLISSGEEGISWRDVLVKVAARCYQIRPDIFLDDARAASLGVGGYADSRKMVGPRQFAEGLYIETHNSAEGIVRTLRKMLSLCRVPYDEVEITYRAGESASSAHRVPAPRHETPKPPSAPEPRETAAFQRAAISRENPLPVREDFADQNALAPFGETRPVDFEDDKTDYSQAKPLSVKLFGAPLENFLPEDMTGEIATWTDVLVKAAAALYRQYPDTFRSKWFFANQTSFGIGDYGKSRAMRTPMRIAGGVFIETHLGDSEKVSVVRRLLDLCHVSYQNVEILYNLEDAPRETALPRENPLPVREDFADQNAPALSGVTRVLNFHDRGADYSRAEPVRVRMFGAPLENFLPDWQDCSIHSWADVLTKVAAVLYRKYRDAFRSLRFYQNQVTYGIGNAKEARQMKMQSPKSIAGGVYIDTHSDTNAKIARIRSLLDLCGVSYDNVEIVYRVPKVSPVSNRAALPVREKPAVQNTPRDTLTVDFEDDLADYSFTKPVRVRLFGAPLSDSLPDWQDCSVDTWTDVLYKTAAALYLRFPAAFSSQRFYHAQDSLRIGNANDAQHMRAFKKISDDMYIDTNSDTNAKIDQLSRLLWVCGVDSGALEIEYVRREGASSEPEKPAPSRAQMSPSQTRVRDAFYTYLVRDAGVSASSARYYVSVVRSAENIARERQLNPCSLFNEDKEVVRATVRALNQDPWFSAVSQDHARFGVALGHLLKFVGADGSAGQGTEADSPDDRFTPEQFSPATSPASPSEDQMRDAFYTYLLRDAHMTNQAANNCVSAVKIAENFAREQGLTPCSLLNEDKEVILGTVRALYHDPWFSAYNSDQHNRFSSAVNYLLEFSRGYCKPASEQPAPEKPAPESPKPSEPEPVYHRESAEPEVPKPEPEKPVPEPQKPFEPEREPVVKPIRQSLPSEASRERMRQAFSDYLLNDARLAPPTVRQYVKYVGEAEVYAREHGYSHSVLYTEDREEILAAAQEFSRDSVFKRYNQEYHNHYSAAINQLLRFSRGYCKSPSEQPVPEPEKPAPSPLKTYNPEQPEPVYHRETAESEISKPASVPEKPAPSPLKTYNPEQPEPVYHRETAEPEISKPASVPEKPAPSPQKTYIPEQPEPVYHRETAEPEVSRPEPEKPAPEPQKPSEPEPVSHRETAEPEISKPASVPEKPAPESPKPSEPEPVSHRETAEPEVPKPEPEKPVPEPQKPFEPEREPVVKPIRQSLPSEASRERMRQAFSDYLLNDARLAPPTVRQYVKYVGEAEVYAREHDYSSIALYTEDREGILAAVREFLGDPAFKRYDEDHHGFYSAAINQFLRFARSYFEPAPEPTVPEKTVPEAPVPEPQKPEPEKPASEPPKSSEPEPAPVAENLSNTVTNSEVSESQKAPAKPRRGLGEMLGSLLKFKRRDKSRDALNEQPAPEPLVPVTPVSETPAPEPPSASEKALPEGEVDIAVLERMYPKLKEELLAEMRREMAAKSPEPVQPAAEPVKPVETAKPAPEPTKPAEPAREGFLIVPARPDEPRLLCETVGRKITTLNFGLTFRLAEPFPARDADFTLIFLDEEYRALTKPTRVLLRAGESQRVSFRLPARAQQLRICYLGVRSASDSEKTLSQLMPFPVSIVFAAADFED